MTLEELIEQGRNELDSRLPDARQRLHEYLNSIGCCLPIEAVEMKSYWSASVTFPIKGGISARVDRTPKGGWFVPLLFSAAPYGESSCISLTREHLPIILASILEEHQRQQRHTLQIISKPIIPLIVPLEQVVISGLLFGLTGWLTWFALAHPSPFYFGLAALSGVSLGGWFVLMSRLNRP